MQNEQSDYHKAYDKAVRLLSMRAHTKFELERKLKMKNFSNELIKDVMEDLSNKKLLNDKQFGETYIYNLIKYKGFGFYGIKAKLMQRGLSQDIISELLQDFDLEQEIEIAKRVAKKNRNPDPQKLTASLARKGFRSEVVRKVLSETN